MNGGTFFSRWRMPASLAATLVVLIAWQASARLPSAGAPMTDLQAYPAATHSWFVMPAVGGREYVLAHVPPRAASDNSGRPAAQGLYRSVTRLTEVPEALAAWENAVFAVFSPRADVSGDPASATRTVRALRAQRFSDSDLWVDQPSGRMDTLPSLPGMSKLAGVAAGPLGPVALLVDEPEEALRLLLLSDRAWRSIEIPEALCKMQRDTGGTRFGVFADARAIYLVAWRRGHWEVWTEEWTEIKSDGEPKWRSSWTAERFSPSGSEAIPPTATWMRVGGRWYAAANAGTDAIDVFEISPGYVRRIADVQPVGQVRALVPLDGLARLMVVSATRQSSPDAKILGVTPTPGAKVIEFSLLTGRIFYSGPAQPLDPLGSGEFRFIAIGLVLAMGLILVLVLRAEEPDGVHLPEGFSFAEPTRRAIATILDIAIVALLIPRLTGNSVLELLGPMVWLDGEAFETLFLLAILGCIVGTVGETFFGRSPGKLLADCEVISIAPAKPGEQAELRRPRFAGNLIRNAIKWFLFPVAALALMDGSGRHRGDQFARAAVVVRFETEDETDRPDDDM
ncbi:MAG: hypothetical protein KF691_07740 [Phycisphaeraceae bacterium]|nr:hypothetical protein [Phycisphaeraceae bacterium]